MVRWPNFLAATRSSPGLVTQYCTPVPTAPFDGRVVHSWILHDRCFFRSVFAYPSVLFLLHADLESCSHTMSNNVNPPCSLPCANCPSSQRQLRFLPKVSATSTESIWLGIPTFEIRRIFKTN